MLSWLTFRLCVWSNDSDSPLVFIYFMLPKPPFLPQSSPACEVLWERCKTSSNITQQGCIFLKGSVSTCSLFILLMCHILFASSKSDPQPGSALGEVCFRPQTCSWKFAYRPALKNAILFKEAEIILFNVFLGDPSFLVSSIHHSGFFWFCNQLWISTVQLLSSPKTPTPAVHGKFHTMGYMGNSKANIYSKTTDRRITQRKTSWKGHSPKGRLCKWRRVGVYRLLAN